jgi:putative chitinase
MTFELKKEHVAEMLKGNKNIDGWYNAMVKILPKYEINSPNRIAGFMAQCGHESVNFTVLEENLNYSAETLEKLFSKYFSKAGRNAADYAKKPEKIANIIYASRMGNGDTASGDGWKHRGRGIIQLTGNENYTNFGNSIGKSVDEVIEYLKTIEGALESACWYWNSRKINAVCDANDITKMSKLVNGGTIGLAERKKHYDHNLTVLVGTTNVVSIKKTKITSGSDLTTALNVGSTGDTVKALQIKLGLNADGTYELRTKRAVKDWQAKNGLTADGVAGPITLKKLLG